MWLLKVWQSSWFGVRRICWWCFITCLPDGQTDRHASGGVVQTWHPVDPPAKRRFLLQRDQEVRAEDRMIQSLLNPSFLCSFLSLRKFSFHEEILVWEVSLKRRPCASEIRRSLNDLRRDESVVDKMNFCLLLEREKIVSYVRTIREMVSSVCQSVCLT